jgi:branched-chain amino acid transport system ATP-binding protein
VRGGHAASVDGSGRRRSVAEPNEPVTEAAAQPQSAEPIVRLRGVGRRFGGVHAVRDVDLDVRPGERRALLGPNGAGKTTLFNVISGEFPPTGGRVELFGQDVTTMPARRRAKLGLTRTFQTSRLFLGLTVEDNLYLAALGPRHGHLRPVRLNKRDGPLRERARELAERVGLEGQLGTTVGSLSHGEQRQLEVGMARAGDPKVMMLDEPAAGLSRGERVLLTDLLLGLDRSITLILIEHDMDVALRVAEQVTMMHDGRVIVEGTPAEIRANQLVHDLYLGSSHYSDE